MSKAEIYKIKNTELSRDDLETLLEEENQYTIQKFAERYHKIQRMEEVERQILERKLQAESEKRVIEERQNKLYQDIQKVKRGTDALQDEKSN